VIEVFDAIEFIRLMEGGSTKPWLVTVLHNGEPVPYVVKLYSTEHNQQNSTVLKECICSLLAQQFDLETPDIALINFTPSFIQSLSSDMRSFLRSRDQRIKFASKLIESAYVNYSPVLHNQYIESFDIGSIYAFDNMILNVDRRIEKPNLFFKNGKVALFDHELTLTNTINAQQSIKSKASWIHNFQRHLFYPVIREMKTTDKIHIFDTFSMYLRDIVNFDRLDSLVDLLHEYDHPVESFFDIKSYLCTLQQNERHFISLLNDTVK
jgi:hypothetical protein